MNDSSLHPLARDYLKRLEKAAAILPRARRNELIEEIESHLSEALPAGASEVEARNVLERLGEPEQIVAEAAPDSEADGTRAGVREWLAIPLLLIGGFVFLIGWIVGLALLWDSKVWTMRDKLIGTFVLPGGLAGVFVAMFFPLTTTSTVCVATKGGSKCHDISGSSGGSHLWGIVLLAVLFTLPIITSIYLTWRANRLSTAPS
jgi:hypothetical protein